MDNERTLTFGEKAVGVTFNPSQKEEVKIVKELYARIIDMLSNSFLDETDGETIRNYKVAITEAQTAQMWAVKAITWENK